MCNGIYKECVEDIHRSMKKELSEVEDKAKGNKFEELVPGAKQSGDLPALGVLY